MHPFNQLIKRTVKILLLCTLLTAATETLRAQAKLWGASLIPSDIISMNTDGSGLQVRHVFQTTTANPGLPNQGYFNSSLVEYTRLTPMNGKLYGTRINGGPNQGTSGNNAGVLFQFDPVTGQDSTLYFFSLPVGCGPVASLTAVNGILWGTTAFGGNTSLNNGNGAGAIFSFNPATGEFTTVYKFSGTPDGGQPTGSLFFNPSDNLLYGMTSAGGPTSTSNTGTLFSIDPAAGAASFQVRANYGGNGGLVLYNNIFYGISSVFNTNAGFIFSYDPATTVFTNLASIGGATPAGLTLFNGMMYAPIYQGGQYSNGNIISFNPATNVVTDVYDFQPGQYGNATGAQPSGDLVVYNNLLWGTTSGGGLGNGDGVLFSYDPVAANFQVQYEFTANDAANNTAFEGYSPWAGVTVYNNKLYGILPAGGVSGGGTIFSWDPSVNKQASLLQFNINNVEGSQPTGVLGKCGNMLYGFTRSGGLGTKGTLFSIDPVSNNFTKAADFFNGTTGSSPSGNPVAAANGKIYSVMFSFGSKPTNGIGTAAGTILEYDPVAGKSTVAYTFSNSTTPGSGGYTPQGPLVAVGNTLYGVAEYGASVNRDGTIFSFDANTHSFTQLFGFDKTNPAIGSNPVGNLIYYNGLLYGTTMAGGANGKGNFFSFDPVASKYTNLHDFTASTFMNYLVLYNGQIYGYSRLGGANGYGNFLSLDPATGTLTDIYDFASSSGVGYFSLYKGAILGTASAYGANGAGYLYSLNLATKTFTDLYDFKTTDPTRPVMMLLKSVPTISFANIKANYGQADIALSATSTNTNPANPITYRVGDASIATIVNGKLHILKAGTTTITAGQAEEEDYSADSVQRVLTVAKVPLTVSTQPMTITYGSTIPTSFTVTYTGFIGTDNASLVTGAPAFNTTATSTSAPGNYPVSVDTTGLSATNYYFVLQPGQLTITKAAPAIQFGTIPATITYGDAPVDPGATSNSGAAPVYSSSNTAVATITGDGKIQFTGAGTATITASFPATTDYTAGSKTLTITVNKKALSLTVDNAYMLTGTALPVFTATFNGLVNGDPASVVTPAAQFSTTASSGSPAGTYPIIITNIGSLTATNYTIGSGYQQGTLTIGSIGFNGGDTRVYGAASYSPGAVSSTGGAAVYTSSNPQVAIINGSNQVQIVGAGQTTITASFAANGSTPAASAQQTLTVQPALLVIKAADASRPYGQPNPAFSFTYQGFVNSDNAASLQTAPQGGANAVLSLAPGTYTITPYGAASPNYIISYGNGTLTVAQAPQTIQFAPLAVQATASPDFALTATASSGLPVTCTSGNPNVATVNGNTVHITGAGTTTITASQGGDADWLPAANVQQTLIVNGTPSNILLPAIPSVVYGASDFTITATSNNTATPITYSSSNLAVATIDANGVIHITGAGAAIITASQAGNSTYNAGSSAPQTLTVNPAPIVVSVADQTLYQGQVPASFVINYTGFVNGEDTTAFTTTATASSTVNASSPAGTYPIVPGGATAANYSFAYTQGQITILPAQTQSISFNSLPPQRYGNADFDPRATATSGQAVVYTSSDPTVATIVNGRVHLTGAGRVTITATQPGGNGYSPATSVAQTITVGKAPLLIRPDDTSVSQGQSLPVFAVTYTGFVNGDDSGALTQRPVVNTAAPSHGSGFGQYALIASGAASPNYDISYQQGMLTVAANGDQLNAFSSSPGQLTVSIFASKAQNATIQLYSLGGQLVTGQPVQLFANVNSFTLNTGNIAPGIYIVNVSGEFSRMSQKIKIN